MVLVDFLHKNLARFGISPNYALSIDSVFRNNNVEAGVSDIFSESSRALEKMFFSQILFTICLCSVRGKCDCLVGRQSCGRTELLSVQPCGRKPKSGSFAR